MKTLVTYFLFLAVLLWTTPIYSEYVSPLTLSNDAATEGSIFDLESVWRNQEGVKLNLADLKGKIRIVAMGYTSCQYACPRIIADLQRIEKELKGSALNSGKISFSFISIDPEVDTPAVMKQLERKYDMNPEHWLLLTGDEDGVLELAVALGMKYRKTSAMDFAHSNIISVISPDGRIIHQTSTLGEDLAETIKVIENLIVSVK
jgi:protein SCO1